MEVARRPAARLITWCASFKSQVQFGLQVAFSHAARGGRLKETGARWPPFLHVPSSSSRSLRLRLVSWLSNSTHEKWGPEALPCCNGAGVLHRQTGNVGAYEDRRLPEVVCVARKAWAEFFGAGDRGHTGRTLVRHCAFWALAGV